MKIKFWAFNMRLWEGMALSFPYFPGTSIERGRLNWINSWQMVSFQMNRMIWNTMWGLVSNWYLMNFWSPGCAFDISVRESTMMPCLMKKKSSEVSLSMAKELEKWKREENLHQRIAQECLKCWVRADVGRGSFAYVRTRVGCPCNSTCHFLDVGHFLFWWVFYFSKKFSAIYRHHFSPMSPIPYLVSADSHHLILKVKCRLFFLFLLNGDRDLTLD